MRWAPMASPLSRAPETAGTSSALTITWLGHATVLVEIDGVRTLTDPVLRDRIGPLVRIVPHVDLAGSVDCVLLSHLHADHTDLPRFAALEPVRPGGRLRIRRGSGWRATDSEMCASFVREANSASVDCGSRPPRRSTTPGAGRSDRPPSPSAT